MEGPTPYKARDAHFRIEFFWNSLMIDHRVVTYVGWNGWVRPLALDLQIASLKQIYKYLPGMPAGVHTMLEWWVKGDAYCEAHVSHFWKSNPKI